MSKQQLPVTPCIDSKAVIAILKKINPNESPFYIKSQPDYKISQNECFIQVDKYIEANGGERVIGWSIWELPNLYVEAIFHAVWKSDDGLYLDLSQRPLETENILFVPDPTLEYEGFQVDNIRIPLTNNPYIHQYLKLHEKIFEFNNRGERKFLHGEISITDPKELKEYNTLMQEDIFLSMQLVNTFTELSIYDPCICGSGKKAKWCHKLK